MLPSAVRSGLWQGNRYDRDDLHSAGKSPPVDKREGFASMERPQMIDFFEFSNEMLSFANPQGYLTRVNAAWTKTLGWTAEELTSRPYLDFVHPEDLEATLKESELLASGTHETIEFENRYRHRDGSYRWLAWRTIVPLGSNELVASARDITERKLVESKLRESEERFRAFMDNNPAIAWAKDEQGRLVYLNKSLQQKFQVKPEDWLGKTMFDLMPEELARPLWEHDQRVLATLEPIQIIEQTAFSPNQATTFWLTVKFLFLDRNGRRFIGGCSIDITDLKQAEQDLITERDVMRNLIALQEKEKQCLCNDFHDGLIQYAVGSLMALESMDDTSPALASSSVIKATINNLRKGIDDGRRILRGIRPAVLDDSGIEAALEDLVGQFSNSDFQVTTDCDPAVGRLPDPVQSTIYRVVQESLNNAKNHSGTDAVRIELKKSDGELQLEIRDFGCGFDLKSSASRGFGLQGMMQRVRLLGGQCDIETKPGAGSRISIRLPLPQASTGSKSG